MMDHVRDENIREDLLTTVENTIKREFKTK
jgi:hypothetical protein